MTQSRIMAKSIKFDQVYYNEVRLQIPSGDNEDRSQALEMRCSLCAWNMQQPAGSHQIITQYLCGSRKLPAQVECPCYIKRQHSEMFLMNIFVRERKGIWMILCVRVCVFTLAHGKTRGGISLSKYRYLYLYLFHYLPFQESDVLSIIQITTFSYCYLGLIVHIIP